MLVVSFWYFNRWVLTASQIAALDFIPIFLVVVSLGVFERHRKTSLLLFSLSLAIKQIAIFIAPLYLIWEYQREYPKAVNPQAARNKNLGIYEDMIYFAAPDGVLIALDAKTGKVVDALLWGESLRNCLNHWTADWPALPPGRGEPTLRPI